MHYLVSITSSSLKLLEVLRIIFSSVDLMYLRMKSNQFFQFLDYTREHRITYLISAVVSL